MRARRAEESGKSSRLLRRNTKYPFRLAWLPSNRTTTCGRLPKLLGEVGFLLSLSHSKKCHSRLYPLHLADLTRANRQSLLSPGIYQGRVSHRIPFIDFRSKWDLEPPIKRNYLYSRDPGVSVNLEKGKCNKRNSQLILQFCFVSRVFRSNFSGTLRRTTRKYWTFPFPAVVTEYRVTNR